MPTRATSVNERVSRAITTSCPYNQDSAESGGHAFPMLRPDEKEFLRLARHASLVPVSKSISADLQTPVSAFLSVAAGEPHAFLLESIEGGEKIGRYTFLGARPSVIVTAQGRDVVVQYPGQKKAPHIVT